ncbi:MAG: hypothetical protein ACLSVD_03285 [Eggerthellaceae bacterium]
MLGACPAVERANVYPRIGSIAVRYRAADGARQRVLDHLDAIDAEAIAEARSSCGLELAPRTQSLLMDIAVLVGRTSRAGGSCRSPSRPSSPPGATAASCGGGPLARAGAARRARAGRCRHRHVVRQARPAHGG